MKRLILALLCSLAVLAVLCAAPAPVEAACGWFPGKLLVRGVRNVRANVQARRQGQQPAQAPTTACSQ